MTSPDLDQDLGEVFEREIRFVRRYARALTGSQASGDAFALATLERLTEDHDALEDSNSVKLKMFRCFHTLWREGQPGPVGTQPEGLEAKAQSHLARLTIDSREALLLRTLEGFSAADIGEIIGKTADEVNDLIDTAHREMVDSVAGRILIIEDETIIALDLKSMAVEMGHDVTGIARTEAEAIAMAHDAPPHLVLADIQLADNSSGIDAVNRMLADLGPTPVIFITAFPERLLTGKRPEPAFLITKPYQEDQVRSAIGQAMFFAGTDVLTDPVSTE